ncbi:hypothetical protein PQG44_09475 [Aquirufa sp. LEPPI-3A]|uniref:hypothetical protein n=1 Tax=Aquirufa regiilacus TaxID=3024868 RepID=UPI0028E051CF|nr:hypothetical protein [Aquirufa sp. LEPPI-3A]MDT8887907.1 hypothetical protein [Aquirufa sp. LEPPI-3A]
MEVHHHGHTPKKVSEYFTEFIMLFAAVTLGFFAENLREHAIEKDREVKFIQIVHEDLLNDIKDLDTISSIYQSRMKREDTLLNLLSHPDYKQTNDLYYLARLNSIRVFFHHSKNGFQQLKNAGGLRLIENIEVIKKIQAYENDVDKMDELQNLTEQLLMNYREKMATIFDGRVFKNMMVNASSRIIEERFARPLNNPALINKRPTELNEFLIKTLYVHNNNLMIASRCKDLKSVALELDELLVKTYHLN